MQMETRRLILREMTEADFAGLYDILSDGETMRFYPAPFDAEKVRGWIRRNRERYETDGFGLWAVVLKENGMLIGDCGITMQPINGQMKPEIGYHIHKAYRRQGFAAEAAHRCMEFAFEQAGLDAVYSYMKFDNAPSYGVALKNGMRFIGEYDDPVNIRTRVYAITREEWHNLYRLEVRIGKPADINPWMELVTRLRDNFPGLETQEKLDAHRRTVLRFMEEGRALCVKEEESIIGALLLSRKRNMICFLAVAPECRRQGIDSALVKCAISMLDRSREITVNTFRADDEKGDAPRALYARFGFMPGELLVDNDYPEQRFVLPAKGVRA